MVTTFDLSSHNLHLAYLREVQMVVSKRPYGQSFAMSGVLVEVYRDDIYWSPMVAPMVDLLGGFHRGTL